MFAVSLVRLLVLVVHQAMNAYRSAWMQRLFKPLRFCRGIPPLLSWPLTAKTPGQDNTSQYTVDATHSFLLYWNPFLWFIHGDAQPRSLCNPAVPKVFGLRRDS